MDVWHLTALIAGLVIGAIAVYFFSQREKKRDQDRREQLIRDYEARFRTLQEKQAKEIQDARKESVSISRSTLKGKLAEQMAPLLPGFTYLPADARFLGDPIDYVVFNGYTNVRDNGSQANELEVVVLDIKQGQAGLTSAQRAIAKAIEAGRVRFEVVRVSDDGTVRSHAWRSRRSTQALPREV